MTWIFDSRLVADVSREGAFASLAAGNLAPDALILEGNETGGHIGHVSLVHDLQPIGEIIRELISDAEGELQRIHGELCSLNGS